MEEIQVHMSSNFTYTSSGYWEEMCFQNSELYLASEVIYEDILSAELSDVSYLSDVDTAEHRSAKKQ